MIENNESTTETTVGSRPVFPYMITSNDCCAYMFFIQCCSTTINASYFQCYHFKVTVVILYYVQGNCDLFKFYVIM